jgi:hypothetical protein
MDKRQTINENKEETAKALKQKTNQDFNGKKPLPNDPDLKKETPEPEVPGIEGKKNKTGSAVGNDGKIKDSSEDYKPEPPTTDTPLNPLPDETIAGDSDAPTIVNKENDGKVF